MPQQAAAATTNTTTGISSSQKLEIIGRLAVMAHVLFHRAQDLEETEEESNVRDRLHAACNLYIQEHGENEALRSLSGL